MLGPSAVGADGVSENTQDHLRRGDDMTNTNETAEPSGASDGSRGDTLSVLRTLADGVRGMGLGDPDSGDRVTASDVVRWAVEEIERLRLIDEEREAISAGADALRSLAGNTNDGRIRGALIITANIIDGFLERTK